MHAIVIVAGLLELRSARWTGMRGILRGQTYDNSRRRPRPAWASRQRPAGTDIPAEAELVWLLARTEELRHGQEFRIRRVAAGVAFDSVSEEMDRHRSRLILGDRARALGIAPDDFVEDLEGFEDWAERRSLLFENLTRQMLNVLESHDIEALPLKGSVLAASAHGRESRRLSEDLDILVRPERLQEAVRVLAGFNYTVDENDRSAFHLVLHSRDEWRPPIELHWRVHWYGDTFARRLLDESAIGESGVRTAPANATVAALLLFYARDGFAGLRLPIDIGGYVERAGDEIDWQRVVGYGDVDPEVRRALRAALAVVREVAGVEVPSAPSPLDRRSRLAMRLANWRLLGDADQIRASMRLVDLLLAPDGTARRFAESRFRPFGTRRENALYLGKTLLRWIPALVSVTRRRAAFPLPAGHDT